MKQLTLDQWTAYFRALPGNWTVAQLRQEIDAQTNHDWPDSRTDRLAHEIKSRLTLDLISQ